MPWPFTSVVAPNLDTGVVGIPTPPDPDLVITTDDCWIIGVYLRNEDDEGTDPIQVFLTMTDGSVLWAPTMPAGSDLSIEWPFRPAVGAKVHLSGASSTVIHLWGYK